MRWQKRIRIVIVVFAVAFMIAVYLAVRPARRSAPGLQGGAAVQDPKASAQSTGGQILNLLRDVEKFRVEYARLLTYPDGRQKLSGAKVTVPHRGGRDFTVTAQEAEVGPGQDLIMMHGAVELTASDGLVAKTDAATYSQGEGILRSPGPATFVKGRLSGSSTGVTYDKARDMMWLLDRAAMHMGPERPGDQGVDITAGSAVLARADQYVRYERGFTLVTGPRTLASETATAYLTEDGARVQSLEMRGRSRITGVGEGAGALRSMDGDDINLEFSADGRTLAGATLWSAKPGRASLDLGASAAESRRVAGQWIDIRFAPDGSTVSSLTVRESVDLTLPASQAEPARRITASTLTATGEAGGALNAARFNEQVEYRELSGAGAPTRTVRARTLELATQAGLAAIDEARFAGAVRFDDGEFQGTSAQARYRVKEGLVELEGADQASGQPPRVTDGEVTIDAAHIEITTGAKKIAARKDVRSTMSAVAKPTPRSADREAHRPGMLRDDQPVFATAAELDYDGSTRVAVYRAEAPARARLWQGDTTILADRLTLDDAAGNLEATGSVTSTLVVEQRDLQTQKVEQGTSIGSSETFRYEDSAHRATYAGKAHVSGQQGDLRARQIELYLVDKSRELDRVEADGEVSLQDGARKAYGDHLTFVSAEGRYVVVGSPVRIEADCRETTGRTLTFFKSTNNIVVEPGEEYRTQVKSVPKCEPGRD